MISCAINTQFRIYIVWIACDGATVTDIFLLMYKV